jgi:arylsulfatase A-like enzyme
MRPGLWISLALLVFSLALFGAAACGAGERGPALDVLLVLIDTLRADRLGCYGNPRGITPHIDRLAEEAVLFEAASAHAPWTLPSTASLLTARLPAQHGAGGRLGAFTGLDRAVPTLAGHFRAAGYATAAVVNVSFLGHDFGLARGFEHLDIQAFESNRKMRRADATTDAALAWLAEPRAGRPFFLLVHYFDPHAVYDPPQPFRARFALEPDRQDQGFVFGTRDQMVALRAGRLELDAAALRRAEALYDGEVAFTDAELGRLFAGLVDLGLDARTAVVLTADHGEEFLDHGGFEHGHTLYGELVHVPLLIRAPGLAPARAAAGVGLIDVGPTLCELAGLPPLPGASGTSLLALLADPGAQDADRPVLAHGNFWGPPLSSWRRGPEKLVRNAPGAARALELYRWREDPLEQRDLAPAEAQRAAELAAELERLEAALERGAGAPVTLDGEGAAELGELGYLDGGD